MNRIRVFQSEFNYALDQRPTINQMKQIVSAQDKTLKVINEGLNEQVEKVDIGLGELDDEIHNLDSQITDLQTQLGNKIDNKDAKKIWEHFQRFAEYQDLKDLYNKCVPELAKFEQKMINFSTDYKRIEQMI